MKQKYIVTYTLVRTVTEQREFTIIATEDTIEERIEMKLDAIRHESIKPTGSVVESESTIESADAEAWGLE